jgi:nucleoside-diphosphate-sugar epimerase
MDTILGAGGAVGAELVKELARAGRPVRLVGRKPACTGEATEIFAADLSDRDKTIEAVSGSLVVYLLVGLKYDLEVWRAMWPRIMSNAIEACKRANARLVFFDNVYMYGKVNGPMTEQTPFNPCSRKGEIRAQLATTLLNEIKAGALQAMIARAADFYGPRAKTGVPNVLVFDKYAKKSTAYWLASDATRHSFTFTADAARSLVLLANTDSAWNETWHVPTTANPPTGKEFITMAAEEFSVEPRYRVLSRPMVKLAGWFDSDVRESYEMLYQSESDYVFDSSKFAETFRFEPTPYARGIHLTAAAYASPAS